MFQKQTHATGRLAVAAICTLALSQAVGAQRYDGWQPLSTLDRGTSILVRNIDTIDTNTADGQVFTGTVDQDVYDNDGRLAIPQGASVELLVRTVSNNDLTLDLDSVMVNGQRYAVTATPTRVETSPVGTSGLGNNRETLEHVGGGALLGTIIGAIAGGGKGAAIGAAVGAAAGAGTQILTRGRSVRVPADTLVTFRLDRPLDLGVEDTGYDRDGYHYHNYDR